MATTRSYIQNILGRTHANFYGFPVTHTDVSFSWYIPFVYVYFGQEFYTAGYDQCVPNGTRIPLSEIHPKTEPRR